MDQIKKMSLALAALGLVFLGSPGHASDRISLKVAFEAPIATKGVADFDIVEVPNLGLTGEPGMPVLPFKTIRILLPPGEEVKAIEVIPGEKLKLKGKYEIEPGQMPVPISQGDPLELTPPNPGVYSQRVPFPARPHKVVSVESMRGYRILLLNLYPVTYVPGTRTVFYHKEMRINVMTRPARMPSPSLRSLAKDRARLRVFVDNPRELETYRQRPQASGTLPWKTLLDPTQSYDYLIITSEELAEAFQRLAEWKNARGVKTTIVTVDYILQNYDGIDAQEQIRSFIRDAYAAWGIDYLLLGGDDEIIPHRGLYAAVGNMFNTDIPSDLYYGALDGSWNEDGDTYWGEDASERDLFAEVYVGRAPVDSVDEARAFVDKVIVYEGQSLEEPYLREALKAGEKLDPGGTTWGGDYKDEVLMPAPPFNVHTLYDKGLEEPWAKGDFMGFINSEMHIINHMGHANAHYSFRMRNEDIDSLRTTLPFLIFTQGCYSAAFDNREANGMRSEQDAIGEDFVTAQNKGAVAYIGNTRYGWYRRGTTDGPSQYFDREFFDAIFGEGLFSLGRALQDAREDNAGRVDEAAMQWCYYTLVLLGDPETHLKVPAVGESPYTPARPSGPKYAYSGEPLEFSSHAIDPQNDDLYLVFDWGDRTTTRAPEAGYVPPGTSLSAHHAFDNDGTYKVRVRAVDKLGNLSPWSPPFSVIVGKVAPLPPIKPQGTPIGVMEETYSYWTYTSDPNENQLFYTFDWGDGTTSEIPSEGWVDPDVIVTGSHAWNKQGTYHVRVRATDTEGMTSEWSDIRAVGIRGLGRAPLRPSPPSGPTEGVYDREYTYETVTTDPGDDLIAYVFDWGDGTTSRAPDHFFVASGEEVRCDHAWEAPGSYLVRVRAIDAGGRASEWSDPLAVEIAEEINEELVIATEPMRYESLGRYSSDKYAQSFISIGNTINGVSVGLIRRSNPREGIQVSIRSSLRGADLAIATIAPAEVTATDYRSPSWVRVYFPKALSVLRDRQYYVVLTVTRGSYSGYYGVCYEYDDPYPEGIYYKGRYDSPRSCCDLLTKVHFGPGG